MNLTTVCMADEPNDYKTVKGRVDGADLNKKESLPSHHRTISGECYGLQIQTDSESLALAWRELLLPPQLGNKHFYYQQWFQYNNKILVKPWRNK